MKDIGENENICVHYNVFPEKNCLKVSQMQYILSTNYLKILQVLLKRSFETQVKCENKLIRKPTVKLSILVPLLNCWIEEERISRIPARNLT